MKKITGLFIYTWLLSGALSIQALAQAQPPLLKRDMDNIIFLAKERLTLLNQMLNQATDQDLDALSKDYLITNSYQPNGNQIFYNDLVIIEDDIDPTHTNADKTDDVSVEKYISNLYLFYAKPPEPNTIVFSNKRFTNPVQNGDLLYIKGFFTAEFKGKHTKIDKPYQPTNRVVEMRADKVNNKWQVRIIRLGFLRPGEGAESIAQTKQAAADKSVAASVNGRPTIPANLSINSAEVQYRQPENSTIITLKVSRSWIDVIQSGAVDVPLGFYQRQEQWYVYDNQNTIELLDNGNRLIFHKGLEYSGYERVKPLVFTLPKSDSAAKPQLPVVAIRPPRADTAKNIVAKTPVPTKNKPVPTRPTVAVAEPKRSTLSPADTTIDMVVQTVPTPKIRPEKVKLVKEPVIKPIIAVPASKTLAPALANALSAEARQRKAYFRTMGWLQIVAGVAGLAGSYAAYSSVKKDYDVYTAQVEKLNADYTNWRAIARQPTGSTMTPMSLTSYGSPGIYGAYAGGAISLGLLVNGIRSLGKAGKVKNRK